MTSFQWITCKKKLSEQMNKQDFHTWISPLQDKISDNSLILYAPNESFVKYIQENLLLQIQEAVQDFSNAPTEIRLRVGESENEKKGDPLGDSATEIQLYKNYLNPRFTFDLFVKGKSNEFACAASHQVASNYPEVQYNPLLIYGGVGLGKTHLMQAIGNHVRVTHPELKVLYLHSERFVSKMIKALQVNNINQFKEFCASADMLLIDDIQFFAGKDRSQEELFHALNSLLDRQKQIVLTCDRYPKEIKGLEERLKSRFGWGLAIAIEPPDVETRVAILVCKAEELFKVKLPYDVAFFIGKHIRSNVRELEGALKRVIAHAQFTGRPLTIDFVSEALRDLITVHDRLVSLENIQRTVGEYFKIKVADLLSTSRSRSLSRPRQIAMALAKELTNHSFPEIGAAFGGRDHTTIIHGCRKIKALLETDRIVQEDYNYLLRQLSS